MLSPSIIRQETCRETFGPPAENTRASESFSPHYSRWWGDHLRDDLQAVWCLETRDGSRGLENQAKAHTSFPSHRPSEVYPQSTAYRVHHLKGLNRPWYVRPRSLPKEPRPRSLNFSVDKVLLNPMSQEHAREGVVKSEVRRVIT